MPRQAYILQDGTRATGVTTVLRTIGYGTDAIAGWANMLGKDGKDYRTELRRAADIGTCAHAQVEALLKPGTLAPDGFAEDIYADAAPCLEAFGRWRSGKRITVVASEQPLVSERWRIGGTFDFVARIDRGPLMLYDVKTSNAIHETYLAQVAAYIAMIAEVHDKQIDTGVIVRLGKDGSCDELVVEGAMLKRGLDLFEHALALYRLEQQIRADAKSATRIWPNHALPVIGTVLR